MGVGGGRGEGNRFPLVLITKITVMDVKHTTNTENSTRVTKISPPNGCGLGPHSVAQNLIRPVPNLKTGAEITVQNEMVHCRGI